jgi:hypothetical protein
LKDPEDVLVLIVELEDLEKGSKSKSESNELLGEELEWFKVREVEVLENPILVCPKSCSFVGMTKSVGFTGGSWARM